MNPGDTIPLEHNEGSSNVAKASGSEIHIALRPEILSSRGCSINQGELRSSSHQAETETWVPDGAMAFQPQVTVQLANPGGGRANDMSNHTEQGASRNVDALGSNSSEGACQESGTKRDPLGLVFRMMQLRKAPKDNDVENASPVTDVNGGTLKDRDSLEKLCRICHLDSEFEDLESNSKTSVDLIQLGCGCRGELGFSHLHCAEAWFELKGNRLCEICGQTATNVPAIAVNSRFIEQWNESRPVLEDAGSFGRGRGSWQGQPSCNFLMACLIIGFVLAWLLRIDLV